MASPGEELDLALIAVTSCMPNAVSPGWGGMAIEVPAGSEHQQSHQHRHLSFPLRFKHLTKLNAVKSRW